MNIDEQLIEIMENENKVCVVTEENGKYFYKGKETTKHRIIKSLINGKNVTINGSKIKLTENKKDFEFDNKK